MYFLRFFKFFPLLSGDNFISCPVLEFTVSKLLFWTGTFKCLMLSEFYGNLCPGFGSGETGGSAMPIIVVGSGLFDFLNLLAFHPIFSLIQLYWGTEWVRGILVHVKSIKSEHKPSSVPPRWTLSGQSRIMLTPAMFIFLFNSSKELLICIMTCST
mgnify:CR=1 FL=1